MNSIIIINCSIHETLHLSQTLTLQSVAHTTACNILAQYHQYTQRQDRPPMAEANATTQQKTQHWWVALKLIPWNDNILLMFGIFLNSKKNCCSLPALWQQLCGITTVSSVVVSYSYSAPCFDGFFSCSAINDNLKKFIGHKHIW